MASRERKLTPTQQAMVQQGGRQQARRTRWEKTPAGAERMRDIRDIVGVAKPGDPHPETGEPQTGYSLSQMYAVENWPSSLEEGMAASHLVHDDQPHLPGLENLEAAPRHMIDSARKRKAERWEDLSPKQQEDTARRVRASSGATLESMGQSYGSQLDQSMMRAREHGQVPPQFYGGGEPNEVISQTARDLKISRGAVSALHADNSPQTPFATGGGDSKNPRRYPQDEMARAAVQTARELGGTVHDASPDELAARRPPGAMGYATNFAKSARRAEEIESGVPAGLTSPSRTTPGFGPKTGPYQRAWTGGTSSQFVADVHSGGGGMVPHLGTAKPILRDASGAPQVDIATGQPKRGSSEREDAISTAGFHLMADKAARDAHRARGLHMPVKRGQEAQWVEEQIQRPDLPQTEERVYGPGRARQRKFAVPEGQLDLGI